MNTIFIIYKKLFCLLTGSNISKIPGVRKVCAIINKKITPETIEVFGNKIHIGNSGTVNFLHDTSDEIDFFKQHINRGEKIIDVGANIGWFSMIFAKIVGNEGKVFSFEPGKDNYSTLRKNISINNFENIVSENVAVSDFNGELNLELSKTGNHKVSKKGTKTKCIKLDGYLKDEKIDFVKIDVEGHEYFVLMGMHNILKNNEKIKLKIEFNYKLIKKSGIKPENLLDFLIQNGFTLYDLRYERQMSKEELIKEYSKIDGATDIFCFK